MEQYAFWCEDSSRWALSNVLAEGESGYDDECDWWIWIFVSDFCDDEGDFVGTEVSVVHHCQLHEDGRDLHEMESFPIDP